PDLIAEKLGISSATWPIFGIVWPSGIVLAHFMNNYDTQAKRILEVGCGMALSSLLLNKKQVDITATDYHPEVEGFLARNVALNGDAEIPFEQTDWASNNDSLGKFDIIIGSDLLYEDEHIELLGNFIENHANPACEVVIVDPGRGRKSKLSRFMESHGFTSTHCKPDGIDYLAVPFKGYVLQFKR
ncbi:MAG: methyltransferase domain-containing protein, partial [Alteromonadaceae bacterium]|nr:methyltransferase domain-containing protein [Alteromonadaceae bacterium]